LCSDDQNALIGRYVPAVAPARRKPAMAFAEKGVARLFDVLRGRQFLQ
jgi:hypothetical protein